MMDPLTVISTRRTPQTEQADPRQVPNSAGGFSFAVDDKARALRFLILGTEGGTYYIGEPELTKQNAANIIAMANDPAKGQRLVELIEDVSVNGRAPKQNPTLFALAACAGSESPQVRAHALTALPRVCRTGTHLFIFARYIEQFRGWGKGLQRAVGRWYTEKTPDQIGYQAVKYQQREGWSHRDLLRLAKIGAKGHTPLPDSHRPVFAWITKHQPDHPTPEIIAGYEEARLARQPEQWARLVITHRLSWEMLPDEALAHPAVCEALVPHMGLTALVRQLPRLTKHGYITPMSQGTKEIVERLDNPTDIQRSRIHPLQLLVALTTYQAGHGIKSKLTWTAAPAVIDALDAAFYQAFGNVEATGKRTLVSCDVSGSMTSGSVAGTFLTPIGAEMALAMMWLNIEPEIATFAFSHQYVPLNLSKRMRLDDAIRTGLSLGYGGTDCSLPMLWAARTAIPVDTFITITDNETWAGRTHPHQALRAYRDQTGIPARLAVVALTSNGFTIADPTDTGMLDVVGFDTATPDIIATFSRGDLSPLSPLSPPTRHPG